MKIFYKRWIWTLPLLALFVFYACKPVQNKHTSPKGYDLTAPEKFNMPERDYEDLAILKETVFVLKSSGTIYVFPLGEIYKKKTENVKVWKHILPDGEYESLYADQNTNKLYAICKNSDQDHKTRKSSGYVFNYYPENGNLAVSGDFKIDSKEIEAFGTPIKSGLKTSALAKNPRTNEWYILSSVYKLLVIATPDWKIKEVHKISSSTFNQPEGIAFDQQSNLYISNEGDEITPGNILKFRYKALK
eukprot:gene17688-21151_t